MKEGFLSRNTKSSANADMTPAVNAALAAQINYTLHEYEHDLNATAYGAEAAAALGIRPDRIFKTLVVSLIDSKHSLAVGIVPVSAQLDLKSLLRQPPPDWC